MEVVRVLLERKVFKTFDTGMISLAGLKGGHVPSSAPLRKSVAIACELRRLDGQPLPTRHSSKATQSQNDNERLHPLRTAPQDDLPVEKPSSHGRKILGQLRGGHASFNVGAILAKLSAARPHPPEPGAGGSTALRSTAAASASAAATAARDAGVTGARDVAAK